MSTYTEADYDTYRNSDEYVAYIMDNCGGERIICNGDALIAAIEEGYLFESFLESLNDHQ
jgi:hypothetical protein